MEIELLLPESSEMEVRACFPRRDTGSFLLGHFESLPSRVTTKDENDLVTLVSEPAEPALLR